MVPEIRSVTDRTFCQFGLFFALLQHEKPLNNPPKNLKNQNFEKLKKTPRDIIIFHKCYTVLEIWHVTDVIIFHFGLFFVLLPP